MLGMMSEWTTSESEMSPRPERTRDITLSRIWVEVEGEHTRTTSQPIQAIIHSSHPGEICFVPLSWSCGSLRNRAGGGRSRRKACIPSLPATHSH